MRKRDHSRTFLPSVLLRVKPQVTQIRRLAVIPHPHEAALFAENVSRFLSD
jgi:hypothetical protein